MYYIIKDNINYLSFANIFIGIEKELLTPDIAVEYANYFSENNPQNISHETIELMILDNYEKEAVLSIIEAFAPKTKKDAHNSLRELRCIILLELLQNEKNKQKLSNWIDEVYADFDYPSDMDNFVSYMPVSGNRDTSLYNEEENINYLISNFEIFIQKEKEWLLTRQKI